MDEIRHAGDFGVLVQEPTVDWGKVLNFKDSVVTRMYKGLSGLVAKKKIELVEGDGRLLDSRTVVVNTKEGERTLGAEKALLLATGSYPRDLPFIAADGDKVHNSNHGLVAGDIPSSVIVVGGNYIGLEFASIYRSFGAEVQVVEMLPKIAPAEDSDISEALNKLLQRRGIKFHLGVSVTGAKPTDSGVEVEIEKDGNKQSLTADRMFVAIGRGPRTDNIGLEEAKIELDKGFIVVDAGYRTNVEGVFAIGDAITVPEANWPHPQLAHVAFIEGMKVAERIAGEEPLPVDYKNIPHVIYCQPEVAAVGLTEDKAKELGMEVQVRRYPFARERACSHARRGSGLCEDRCREGRCRGRRSHRRATRIGSDHRGPARDVVGGLPKRARRTDPSPPDPVGSDG